MSVAISDPKAIFFAALDQPSPEERLRYLDAACGDDRQLRSRVEQLLVAHDQAGQFLGGSGATIDSLAGEQPGSQIGPYKLLQQIGEGGMGVVYMAEQLEPVKRRVALKIIKPGMDTRQVIARFEAERQALSLMDHPNIAKVLDAGTTDSGRPYFVLELVKGQPITQCCDKHHLTPRQRLELLLPVCQAIQHAHQKGIIHRDIKPTNILVAEYDQQLVPKVIDFGVAKAMSQPLIEKTLFTGFGQIVGTLEYMSPEQAKVNQLDIDTRSDIYSLGVLLYELLTGSTPFDKGRLRSAGWDEMLRIIREEEPTRPSTKLSTAEGLPALAANRGTEPAKLTKLVRGELDWIVMKALEKDRSRRYETANDFALDMQSYLADEPVQACPASAAYRFLKFARRHKAGVAIAAVTLLFVVLLGSGAGWIVRDKSARHAETAARIDSALLETARLRDEKNWLPAQAAAQRADVLLAGSDDHLDLRHRLDGLVKDLQMVERLDRIGEDQLREQDGFWDHAGADAAYAAAFREYGIDVLHLDVAVAAQHVKVSAIAQQLVPALDDWTWVSRGNASRRKLVRAVVCLADPDPWRVRFRDPAVQKDRLALEELAGRPEVAGQPPYIVAFLGRALSQAGASAKAIEVLTAAQRRHPEHFWLNMHLGSILRWGVQPPRYLESAGYIRAALALRPDAVRVHLELGASLLAPESADEAIAHLRRALELEPAYAQPHHVIGQALAMQGNWHGAIDAYQTCLRGKTIPQLAVSARCELAAAYRATGALDKAVACAQEAIQIEPQRERAHIELGQALEWQGKLVEALAAFRQAQTLDPKSAWAHVHVGRVLGKQQKWDESVAVSRHAVALDPELACAHNVLGWALTHQEGKIDEAIAALHQAVALDSKDVNAHFDLGNALIHRGKYVEASAALSQAVALDPKFLNARLHLGRALRKQGQLGEAISVWKNAVELDPNFVAGHTALAWYLATAPDPKLRDPHTALVHAQRAVDLAPTANRWSNLGVALLRAGEFQASVENLEKADQMWEGDHRHRFFLAMAYWQVGEKDKARQAFDEGATWIDQNQPNNEELRRFRAEAEDLMSVKERKD
jgi:serine/threonine protein kinase/Flp pilus assembly protein TadD